jgi:LCP family protein required for cell wall assembly
MHSKLNKKLVPDKVKKRRRSQYFKKLLFTLIFLFLLFELVQINGWFGGSKIRPGGTELEILENEIKEIKEYLLLPTDEAQEQEDELQLTLFELIADYEKEQSNLDRETQIQQAIDGVLTSNQLKTLRALSITKVELIKDSTNSYAITLDDGPRIMSFGLDADGQLFQITPIRYQFLEPENFEKKVLENLDIEKLRDYEQKLSEIQTNLESLSEITESEQITSLLEEKELTLGEFDGIFINHRYEANIYDDQENVVAKLVYYPAANHFYIANNFDAQVSEEAETIQSFQAEIVDYLTNNKFLSLREQQIAYQYEQLKKSLESNEFKSALKASDLDLTDFSETSERISISVLSESDLVFTLYINKEDASLWLIKNGEETMLESSAAIFETTLQSNKKEFNILLAGKHGSLTDTMILTNINHEKKKVTLISIPRDIYWNERKINSYYLYEGMNGLVNQIEQMTSTEIDNYMLVDMYAFIDVVDYLGGIDVTLDEPLIDPTYKTFDNGKWGTLYYTAGTHHLNGKQALRVARSRHTSSDFHRAERQHQVLEGFKDKANNLNAGNAGTLIKIASTLLSKTETDISATQAVNYYFKYKNYEISSQHVLSTANVLASSNLPAYQGATANGTCADCVGMYVLQPKGNDWNLIASYIQNILQNA